MDEGGRRIHIVLASEWASKECGVSWNEAVAKRSIPNSPNSFFVFPLCHTFAAKAKTYGTEGISDSVQGHQRAGGAGVQQGPQDQRGTARGLAALAARVRIRAAACGEHAPRQGEHRGGWQPAPQRGDGHGLRQGPVYRG